MTYSWRSPEQGHPKPNEEKVRPKGRLKKIGSALRTLASKSRDENEYITSDQKLINAAREKINKEQSPRGMIARSLNALIEEAQTKATESGKNVKWATVHQSGPEGESVIKHEAIKLQTGIKGGKEDSFTLMRKKLGNNPFMPDTRAAQLTSVVISRDTTIDSEGHPTDEIMVTLRSMVPEGSQKNSIEQVLQFPLSQEGELTGTLTTTDNELWRLRHPYEPKPRVVREVPQDQMQAFAEIVSAAQLDGQLPPDPTPTH